MNKKIAIFGGTGCRKEKEPYYFGLAYEMGKLLAENYLTVITGAGPGLMNEALRGASEAGGETIGVGLNVPGRQHSKYAANLTVFDKLGPRQDKMIEMADGYIALPGGLGTLYEINNILILKKAGEMPVEKPLVLVGSYYRLLKNVFDAIITEGFADSSILSFCKFVDTPQQALAIIRQSLLEVK